MAKNNHRGIYVEEQLQAGGKYLWRCHTGLRRFLPDLYETREDACAAIDAKLSLQPQN